MIIIYLLAEHEIIRYNELRRLIGGITYKTLSSQLKELEKYNLIVRTEYHQIPPKVEYSLSAKGKTLLPIFDAMCEWGMQQK
jgi:DNA-binding HxlR family transcriptional regulator